MEIESGEKESISSVLRCEIGLPSERAIRINKDKS